MYGRIKQIHLVGIGGAGMSGIAEVLLARGYRVRGSDLKESETTRRLVAMGAEIAFGHSAENLDDANVVVISSAVPASNPEVLAAKERGIPVIPRAEMLAELMRMKYGIAVAGTHGKTSTTSLIASVLTAGGIDPTVVVGGKLRSVGSHATLGAGEFFVTEADESDGSFLLLTPTIAVITNIDPEHLSHYGSMERVLEAYTTFANKVPFFGVLVACHDHPTLQDLLPSIRRRVMTYGLSAQADVRAEELEFHGSLATFTVVLRGQPLGRVTLRVPGRHNVLNALASIAVACELEIPFRAIKEGLEDFEGVHRRFEIKGDVDDVLYVDDYGHHPEEIRATLSAAKGGWKRRVVAIFQPHRYSRTQELLEDFARCFNDADVVFVTDIYAAGEKPIEGVSAENLVAAVRRHGHKNVHYLPDPEAELARIEAALEPGDLCLTLGAGNIGRTCDQLVGRAHERRARENA